MGDRKQPTPPPLPAFPGMESPGGGYPGMELRDWFAGQALVATMAHEFTRKDCGWFGFIDANATQAATHAYMVADAMLAAREKP